MATYALFHYKFRSNTSDTSYEELRRIISNLSLHTINIKSLHATRECLGQLLHLRNKKYDAYIDGCMAFTGSHLLCRRCLYCKKARFVETTQNAEKFYPNLGSGWSHTKGDILLYPNHPTATTSVCEINGVVRDDDGFQDVAVLVRKPHA